MKLTVLLAQYLYINKRLDLAGIGTFLLDPSVHIDQENIKQGKSPPLEGVSFESNPSTKESPELIQFITTETGKIKALASADLQSHLGLALQFINIGKPFLFEGIGSLAKINAGGFSFTAGQIITERLKEHSPKKMNTSSANEELATDYKSIFYIRKVKMKWAKPVTIFLILAGLGLAIWGGYTVYKRTSAENNNITTVDDSENITLMPENTSVQKKDSIPEVKPTIPAGSIKFVLEVANAERAFQRYGKLRTFQWAVQMETSDSVSYKIFMLLPVTAADTARILDSLTMLNGKRVYIEN